MTTDHIALIGTFSGDVSGELNCNLCLKKWMDIEGVKYKVLDTNLEGGGIKYAGSFSFKKILKMFSVYFVFFKVLLFSNVLYMTPGLSKFGFVRFSVFVFFGKLFRRKIVFHYHGARLVNERKGFSYLYNLFVIKVLSYVDTHIFLTEVLELEYKRSFLLVNTKVIFNFFDSGLFDYLTIKDSQEKNSEAKSKIKFLFLSNMIEEKGYKIALDACEKLALAGYDVFLDIAGGGDDKAIRYVEKFLNSQQLDGLYHGLVSGVDKYKLFADADYFLFPTTYKQEGLPLVLLEAMISKCCVVTTPIGGIPDLIKNDENGALVNVEELVDSTYECLVKLIKNPKDKLRIVNSAFETAIEFDEEKFASSVYLTMVES
ncbi:hypothetical protein CKO50_14625 [Pseudoalteromonas sp. HM-SA03]|uniref:glycosyltransferase family 4 protein n=1 Tax=Pseudoalteromonas sp. HM-SA03 TaxID=2029678 RepID=UPI000BAE69C5|nr:glycosyltransferase family 4 protein [Pseudoalteromonas sp. HM-SA03]PAY00662.1 hypothetical protein CKO50_14625 [Pseudoalteromonas sp. HM-SA03]